MQRCLVLMIVATLADGFHHSFPKHGARTWLHADIMSIEESGTAGPSWGRKFGDESLIDGSKVSPNFRAGFVSIIGHPNVGKSTLMNHLVGDRLSIATSKAQTTRHRIMGIVSGEEFQLIYSDTPGILTPKYALHTEMMESVRSAVKDADVILAVVDSTMLVPAEDDPDDFFSVILKRAHQPVVLALNKIDKISESNEQSDEKLQSIVSGWQALLPNATVVPVSAKKAINCDRLLAALLSELPKHPPLYPADTLTDKPERFFASEMIREKIFTTYDKEVPYSSEVVVRSFKDEAKILKISAVIYVLRSTQKGIIIGKNGAGIKNLGTKARTALEAFFGKPVYLELNVEVDEEWRSNEATLRRNGYGVGLG